MLNKILITNPIDRIKLADIKSHKWFTAGGTITGPAKVASTKAVAVSDKNTESASEIGKEATPPPLEKRLTVPPPKSSTESPVSPATQELLSLKNFKTVGKYNLYGTLGEGAFGK